MQFRLTGEVSEGGKGAMRILQGAVMAALMMGAGTGLASAQIGAGAPMQLPSPGRGGTGFPSDGRQPDDPLPRIQDQLAKSRNSERQKRLVADTDRLLALVEDLKRQIEDPDGQPADVTKKAEEIERLAKSVKERMKG